MKFFSLRLLGLLPLLFFLEHPVQAAAPLTKAKTKVVKIKSFRMAIPPIVHWSFNANDGVVI